MVYEVVLVFPFCLAKSLWGIADNDIVVVVQSRLSTSPLAVAWMMLDTSWSNYSHLVVGKRPLNLLLWNYSARIGRLWSVGEAGFCELPPGRASPVSHQVRDLCVAPHSLSHPKHFIMAWWILRLCWFMTCRIITLQNWYLFKWKHKDREL